MTPGSAPDSRGRRWITPGIWTFLGLCAIWAPHFQVEQPRKSNLPFSLKIAIMIYYYDNLRRIKEVI